MNLQSYIQAQKITKDTKTTKLQFLKSVSELLLTPNPENLKLTIKYLSILANSYHVTIKPLKATKSKYIETVLLNKVSEIIKNEYGYMQLIPETFKIIVSYAKNKGIKLIF